MSSLISSRKRHKLQLQITESMLGKFCHDMAGVIGALNNASEMLDSKDPEVSGDVKKLIIDAASQAVHKLRLYRKAYGSDDGDIKVLLKEYCEPIFEYLKHKNLYLDWNIVAEEHRSPGEARLVLNLLILFSGIYNRDRFSLEERPGLVTISSLWKQDNRIRKRLGAILEVDSDTSQSTHGKGHFSFIKILAGTEGAELKYRFSGDLFKMEVFFH